MKPVGAPVKAIAWSALMDRTAARIPIELRWPIHVLHRIKVTLNRSDEFWEVILDGYGLRDKRFEDLDPEAQERLADYFVEWIVATSRKMGLP